MELPASVSSQHLVSFKVLVGLPRNEDKVERTTNVHLELTLPVHLRYPDPACKRRGEDCEHYAWVEVRQPCVTCITCCVHPHPSRVAEEGWAGRRPDLLTFNVQSVVHDLGGRLSTSASFAFTQLSFSARCSGTTAGCGCSVWRCGRDREICLRAPDYAAHTGSATRSPRNIVAQRLGCVEHHRGGCAWNVVHDVHALHVASRCRWRWRPQETLKKSY